MRATALYIAFISLSYGWRVHYYRGMACRGEELLTSTYEDGVGACYNITSADAYSAFVEEERNTSGGMEWHTDYCEGEFAGIATRQGCVAFYETDGNVKYAQMINKDSE